MAAAELQSARKESPPTPGRRLDAVPAPLRSALHAQHPRADILRGSRRTTTAPCRHEEPARYRAFLTFPQRSTRRIDGFSFRLSPTPGSPATDGSGCCATPYLLTSCFASAKGAQWPPPNLNSARLSRERAGEGPCWSRGGGARCEESGERRGGIGVVLCAVTRSGRSCWAFPAVPAR